MRVLIVMSVVLAACGDDGTSTEPGHWQLLGERRPSALLAAWSPRLDDAWIVGGREGAGGSPAVWHYDGSNWTKLDTGQPNIDIWQVFGFDDAVFLGGSNGTILRYKNGTFEKLSTPSTDIVFGLWGSSSSDLWATGGQLSRNAFVWHFDGTAFTPVGGVPQELVDPGGGAVWKVTGRATDDVWMSASRGYVLHWDGQALTSERIGGTDESLFSIGCARLRCTAIGANTTNGVLYDRESAGWTSNVPTLDGPALRGITPVGEPTYVVGQFGVVMRHDGKGWLPDNQMLTTETFHAAWSDASGNLWAVGGKFDRAITIDGMLLFKGAKDLPPLP